jgi:hypothetical protein
MESGWKNFTKPIEMNALKKLIVFGLFGFIVFRFSEGSAQTWDELFRQKETQKEYLILQIGALEIQSNLLAESASIFRSGLEAIGSWKGLEKDIHTDFFDSFKTLGPISRAEYERMMGVELSPEKLLSRIEYSSRYWQNQLIGSEYFDACVRIHSNLKSRVLNEAEELNSILGSDLELEDSDRAKRLIELSKELEMLHRDLMQLQVLLTHRVQMNEQRSKWQKETSNY